MGVIHKVSGLVENMELARLASHRDPAARCRRHVARNDATQIRALLQEMGERFGAHRLSYVDARVKGVGRPRIDKFETARTYPQRNLASLAEIGDFTVDN